MAVTIVAGVCEERQYHDCERIKSFKAEYPKKGNRKGCVSKYQVFFTSRFHMFKITSPKLRIAAGIPSKNPPSSPAKVTPPSHNIM